MDLVTFETSAPNFLYFTINFPYFFIRRKHILGGDNKW